VGVRLLSGWHLLDLPNDRAFNFGKLRTFGFEATLHRQEWSAPPRGMAAMPIPDAIDTDVLGGRAALGPVNRERSDLLNP
jgi:hypothetical protein